MKIILIELTMSVINLVRFQVTSLESLAGIECFMSILFRFRCENTTWSFKSHTYIHRSIFITYIVCCLLGLTGWLRVTRLLWKCAFGTTTEVVRYFIQQGEVAVDSNIFAIFIFPLVSGRKQLLQLGSVNGRQMYQPSDWNLKQLT